MPDSMANVTAAAEGPPVAEAGEGAYQEGAEGNPGHQETGGHQGSWWQLLRRLLAQHAHGPATRGYIDTATLCTF